MSKKMKRIKIIIIEDDQTMIIEGKDFKGSKVGYKMNRDYVIEELVDKCKESTIKVKNKR